MPARRVQRRALLDVRSFSIRSSSSPGTATPKPRYSPEGRNELDEEIEERNRKVSSKKRADTCEEA